MILCAGCDHGRPHACRRGRALVGGVVECDCTRPECNLTVTATLDNPRCTRDVDDIMRDYDRGSRDNVSTDSVDMRAILWEVIDTVRDSYALALRSMFNPISPAIEEIERTVDDFVTNAFGDD